MRLQNPQAPRLSLFWTDLFCLFIFYGADWSIPRQSSFLSFMSRDSNIAGTKSSFISVCASLQLQGIMGLFLGVMCASFLHQVLLWMKVKKATSVLWVFMVSEEYEMLELHERKVDQKCRAFREDRIVECLFWCIRISSRSETVEEDVKNISVSVDFRGSREDVWDSIIGKSFQIKPMRTLCSHAKRNTHIYSCTLRIEGPWTCVFESHESGMCSWEVAESLLSVAQCSWPDEHSLLMLLEVDTRMAWVTLCAVKTGCWLDEPVKNFFWHTYIINIINKYILNIFHTMDSKFIVMSNFNLMFWFGMNQ